MSTLISSFLQCIFQLFGKVVPLFKKENRPSASNYRHVLLLTTLSKVMEKVV